MAELLDEAIGAGATGGPPTAGSANVDVGQILRDPAFQRMAPAAQQRVLATLGVQGPGAAAPGLSLVGETPPPTEGGPPPDQPFPTAIPGALKEKLVDPTYRLLTGRSQGAFGLASDALSTAQLASAGVIGLANPAAGAAILAAPAAGAVVQGLLTDFNVRAGWPQFLGNLTELAVGGAQGLGGPEGLSGKLANWYRGRQGGQLVREATAGGAVLTSAEDVVKSAAQVRQSQAIGSRVITQANAALDARAKPIKAVLDATEDTVSKMTVGPGNPLYDDVADLVQQAEKLGVTAPALEKIKSVIAANAKAAQQGLPTKVNLKLDQLVELQKQLRDKSLGYARSLADPNAPAAPKLAARVRGLVSPIISRAAEQSLGAQAGAEYDRALLSYGELVQKPKRILDAVLSKKLEPSTAFEIAFNPRTPPEVLQTLGTLAKADPVFQQTLRLGAMQHFFAATGGDLTSPAAMKAYKEMAGPLATTGLFSEDELANLKFFLRPGMAQTAMAKLSQAVSPGKVFATSVGTAGIAAVGGRPIGHLISTHPELAFMAITATGGLAYLRRVAMAPPKSPAAIAAGTAITKSLARLGASLVPQPTDNTGGAGGAFGQ